MHVNFLRRSQVIALNSSGEAEGELYVDDGKSFSFREGVYIHRRFVFSNGNLKSINLAPSAKFPTKCTIERIILLGHTGSAKGAIVEPGNKKTEVESGPLLLKPGSASGFPTVRRPNLPIDADWTVKILWESGD